MPRVKATVDQIRTLLCKPTSTTTLTNLAILGGNAVAGVVSARALGPAGRGQLAIVMLWSALISMVGNLGLPSSCSYHVARWPDRRAVLVARFRRIALQQAAAMTLVSVFILWWLRIRLRLEPQLAAEYVSWAGAATITLYSACYAQGLGDFFRFNVIRLIPAVMPALLMAASSSALHLTPVVIAATYLVPTWASAVLGYAWLGSASRASLDCRSLSPRERRQIWSYGWRSLASFSGLAINRSSDQLALGLLTSVGSLGIYSVAVAASSPLPSVVASFGMVGLPTVASLAGRPKASATWRALWRATVLLAAMSPILAFLIPWAIPLVYGHQYSAAVVPAEILLIGTGFAALASVIDDLLRAYGHPGFVSITQGAGGAVTVIGTVMLGGRPLISVAVVSSLGYGVAFGLALTRLIVATLSRRSRGKHRAVRSGKALPSPVHVPTMPAAAVVDRARHPQMRRQQ